MGQPPTYPPEAVQFMRDELTSFGIEELLTPEDVDKNVSGSKGTTLCMINSICGCAAGSARPGVGLALQHKLIPDRITTAFAGMEHEAVRRVRELHASAAPPSSPSIVLFKDGEVATIIERHQIEGRTPPEIAETLAKAFNEHCTKEGPSIPADEFSKLKHIQACGSSIPRMPGQ